MPGLHLSLGIFNRLFSLLEADCQQLDLQLAARETGIGGASFQEYAQLLSQFTRLQQEHSEERDKRNFHSQLLSYLLVSVPSPQQSTTVQNVQAEVEQCQRRLSAMVN